MKNKNKNKYVVICDEGEVSDVLFMNIVDAVKFAKECVAEGQNEVSQVFEIVPVKKFKMLPTEVKD